MSEAATATEKPKYTIESGDTIWKIVEQTYGTTDPNFIIAFANHNKLPHRWEKHELHVDLQIGDKIEIPISLLYNQKNYQIDINNNEVPVLEITNQTQINRVEFHYEQDDSVFADNTLMNRRFIYQWKKRYPKKIEINDYHSKLYNKVTGDNVSTLDNYYERNNQYSHYILNKSILSKDDKEKLYAAYKEAEYEDAWINGGVLMTDDWGQPWDIEGYINNCAALQRFEYIEVPNDIYSDKEQSAQVFSRDPSYRLSKNHKFAFYSPKQINEIRFVDVREVGIFFKKDLVVDKRVYFRHGEEYAFSIAPLDVLWARDEVMDLTTYPSSGSTAPEVEGYEKYVKKLLQIDDIFEFPPLYKTNQNQNVYKLIEEEKVQEISFYNDGISPSDTDLCDNAFKIELKPNLAEYLSLLRKYNYDLYKTLNMNNRVMKKADELKIGLQHIRDFTTIIENGSKDIKKESNEVKNYIEYNKKIEALIKEVDKAKNMDNFPDSIDSTVSGSEYGDIDSQLELISTIKTYKYNDNNLSTKFDRIKNLLNDSVFVTFVKEYFEDLERSKKNTFTQFFGFRHPIITPLNIITESYGLLKDSKSQKFIDDLYSEDMKQIDNFLEGVYDNHPTTKEYHNLVTKPAMENVLNTEIVIKPPEGEDGEDIVEPLMDSESLRDCFERAIGSYIPESVLDNNKVLNILLKFTLNENITGFWNTQQGPSCTIDKLLSTIQYIRKAQLSVNISALRIATLELKLNQITTAFFMKANNKLFVNNEMINELKKSSYLTISSNYYKKKIKNIFMNRRKINVQQISRLQKRCKVMSNSIQNADNDIKEFQNSKVTQRVSTALSGFQLYTSMVAVYCFIIKLKAGEVEQKDVDDLICAISSGGLALTGLPIDKFFERFAKLQGYNINATKNLLAKVESTSRLAGRILTIPVLLIGIKNATHNFLISAISGDEQDQKLAIIGFGVNVLGLSNFGYQLIRYGSKKLLSRAAMYSSVVGLVSLYIMLGVELYKWYETNLKRGGVKLLKKMINNIIEDNYNLLKSGYHYEDKTEIYTLGCMWRLHEGNFETYEAIDELSHRVIRHSIDVPAININSTMFNVDRLHQYQLDYRYSVPAFVFKGYPEDAIISIHQDGIFTIIDEDQYLIDMKVKYLIRFWIDEDNEEHVEGMKEIIEQRYTLVQSGENSLDDDFWNETYVGLKIEEEKYIRIKRLMELNEELQTPSHKDRSHLKSERWEIKKELNEKYGMSKPEIDDITIDTSGIQFGD